MKLKLTNYSMYSLKVLIGSVILLIVAIVTTPDVFREKFWDSGE